MLSDPSWQPNDSRLIPQVVEDCSLDVGPEIGAEWTLLTGLEALDSFDQAQSADMYKVGDFVWSDRRSAVQWAERGRDVPQSSASKVGFGS